MKNRYMMPAIRSQTPLKAKVVARGFNGFGFIFVIVVAKVQGFLLAPSLRSGMLNNHAKNRALKLFLSFPGLSFYGSFP